MLQISVVIPVYNGERFIGEAIQSVLDQTCQAFEIIVVDDGSADATEVMIGEISSPIPVRYYRQENHGAGAARNLGVSVARGDWVAFLDADDVWFPQKLAEQITYVQSHSEASFVYSNAQVTDEAGRPIGSIRRPEIERQIFDNDQPFAQLSTVLMRKDLFIQAGGFPPKLRLYEDVALYARITNLTAMHFMPSYLSTYRFHAAQSTRNPILQANSWMMLLQFLLKLWESDPLRHEDRTRYLVRFCGDECKYYMQAGDFHQAQRFGRLAFAYKKSWKNLRRLMISFLPGLRSLYYGMRSDSIGE
jgi:glycosyltransferase involved in cell wall biosynthesis